jgi:hypothetical protein
MAATHTRAQAFQRPELKLLNRALRPSQFLRDVANAFFFHETFDDDGPLISRKTIDQPGQRDAPLDIRPVRRIEIVGNRIEGFS